MRKIHYFGALFVIVTLFAYLRAQNVSSPLPVMEAAAFPAGSNVIGKVDVDQTTPGTTNAVEPIPSTDSSVAVSQKSITANTAQSIKAAAGNVYGWSLYNANSSVCYLQFYNTSSTPTCGTSVVWSFPIPASGTSTVVPPFSLYNHSTGIGFCAGTTATGSTACSTALSGTVLYK